MENLSLRSGRNNGTREQTSAGMEFPPAAGKNFIIFQKIFCIAGFIEETNRISAPR